MSSKIQILKGDVGKSITVEKICVGNSFCFVYSEDRLSIGDYYLNSTVIDIDRLMGYIEEWIDDGIATPYDFFVIYTNQNENELSNLFEWLLKNEDRIDSRIIIVTCK